MQLKAPRPIFHVTYLATLSIAGTRLKFNKIICLFQNVFFIKHLIKSKSWKNFFSSLLWCFLLYATCLLPTHLAATLKWTNATSAQNYVPNPTVWIPVAKPAKHSANALRSAVNNKMPRRKSGHFCLKTLVFNADGRCFHSDGLALNVRKIFHFLPTGGVRLGTRANAGRGF